MIISNKDLLMNEQIREREVRVVDQDNSQLGIMQTRDALRLAEEKNLDLVMISPTAKPPVCRIMDYGKFKFEQAKKQKDAKKKQKVIELKEIRLTLNIDTHDLETKTRHAIRFLEDGDKVKVSVRFKGREMTHVKLGETLMLKVRDLLAPYAAVDKPPKLEGRNMVMFLSPKTTK